MRINSPLRLCAALPMFVLGLCVAPAHAQSAIGFGSAGPIAVFGLGYHDFGWKIGGGGEWRAGPYGVGGELNWVHMREVTTTFDQGRGSATSPQLDVAEFTVASTYHVGWADTDRRLYPFVSAGLSYMIGRGSIPTLDVAGGFHWWRGRNTGLRVEARLQYGTMIALRCGIVFR